MVVRVPVVRHANAASAATTTAAAIVATTIVVASAANRFSSQHFINHTLL
jgi:hypothetical protein